MCSITWLDVGGFKNINPSFLNHNLSCLVQGRGRESTLFSTHPVVMSILSIDIYVM